MLEDLGVGRAAFGHADGARLAETDAVAEAGAVEDEAAGVGAGEKQARLQAAEQAPDVELAGDRGAAVRPDDGERFREINEAYACLSDKDQRARYDRWGHADEDAASGIGAEHISTAGLCKFPCKQLGSVRGHP